MLPYVGYGDAPRESQEVVVPVPRVSVGHISPWVNKACSAHRFRSQAMPRTRPCFISQCTQPGPHLTPHPVWVGALFVHLLCSVASFHSIISLLEYGSPFMQRFCLSLSASVVLLSTSLWWSQVRWFIVRSGHTLSPGGGESGQRTSVLSHGLSILVCS